MQVHQLMSYAIHEILFHRAVYTKEEFDIVQKWGQTLYILADFATANYIETFLSHVDDWLHAKQITHLALVILAKDDGRTLERWTFDVKDSKSPILQPPLISSTKTPSKDTTQDLATLNVLKQIIAATTMLPDLPAPAVFTLQAYVADEEESHTLSGEWKEVNSLPFDKDTEVQHTQLRGVKMEGKEVGVWLTSMDD